MDLDQTIDVNVENILDRGFLYAATALFALTIVLTTLQVMVRQLPFLSFLDLNWTVPMARFTLIVMTYVGGAVVTRNQEHISIDLILEWVGEYYPRFRLLLAAVADLIVIGFLVIAVYSAALSTSNNWTTTVGAVSGITSGYIYLGIGIGLSGMLIYELDHFSTVLRTLVKGSPESKRQDKKDSGVEDV